MEHNQSFERKVDNADSRYRQIFDDVHVALWVEDFSDVVTLLDHLRADGVHDLCSYLQNNPATLREAFDRLRVLDVNAYAVEMFEADDKATLLNSLSKIFLPETEKVFIDELLCIWEGRSRLKAETMLQTLKGRKLDVTFTIAFNGDKLDKTLVSVLDISERRAAEIAHIEQTRRLQALNDLVHSIAADLDLESLVQRVVDAGRELSGAQYGAFF